MLGTGMKLDIRTVSQIPRSSMPRL